jgi:uncharacterized protein YcaQ
MLATLERLRRYALARSLFAPTTLKRAIHKLGFLQADPIRAPARAQDLTLRQRVKDYRAGDLERRYARLGVAEDFFVNYGFLPVAHQALMHPRAGTAPWTAAKRRQAEAVLAFVRERGIVHPREVDLAFAHGRATNWFGGTSAASTQLLDAMHYRGLLRVARRESGIRLYAAHEHAVEPLDAAARRERIDALVDIVVRKYAPLPATSLSGLVWRLRYGAPQWQGEMRAAVVRARQRLAHARVDGIDWYWPADETLPRRTVGTDDTVRLLAPFDPVVWDRKRFELFWGWAYRFEAYTPAPKRQLGYYALPLLWRDEVIGWGNLALTKNGALTAKLGYVAGGAPRDAVFRRELDAELSRIETFVRPQA